MVVRREAPEWIVRPFKSVGVRSSLRLTALIIVIIIFDTLKKDPSFFNFIFIY